MFLRINAHKTYITPNFTLVYVTIISYISYGVYSERNVGTEVTPLPIDESYCRINSANYAAFKDFLVADLASAASSLRVTEVHSPSRYLVKRSRATAGL